jgi:hypothetical protein
MKRKGKAERRESEGGRLEAEEKVRKKRRGKQ